MPMPVLFTLREGEYEEKTYQHSWIIPKWLEVSQREDLLEKHAFIIKANANPWEGWKEHSVQTKWRVEWKLMPVLPTGSATKSCQVHWTLIDMKGVEGQSLFAKIKTSVARNYGDGPSDPDYQSDEQGRYFRLNEPVETSFFWISEDVLKPDGKLSVRLNLTLFLPNKRWKKYMSWEQMESVDNVFLKAVHDAEKAPMGVHVTEKVDGVKKEKTPKKKKISWHSEWHDAEAVGSENLHDDTTTTTAGSGNGGGSGEGDGAGTSTSNQGKASSSCSGNGRKSDKSRKNKTKRKRSKRIRKNDNLVNQEGGKKVKLESDYCAHVKEERGDQDGSSSEGDE